MILALDIGSTMGWAKRLDDDSTRAGSWVLVKGRRKWRDLVERLDEANDDDCIELVVYEVPSTVYKSAQAARSMLGLEAMIQYWCEVRRKPTQSVIPTALKKHMTGNGRADKDAMKAAARERYPGVKFDSSHAGDALCVLAWAEDTVVRVGAA